MNMNDIIAKRHRAHVYTGVDVDVDETDADV